ncbi:hypothetical protein ABT369_25550 [Dactylosporangium sp. NPDC000244]|uniref:hypothetical protein n=1 Tax=Dactylosporangium sp. NPDC000244 TaxID=3154365 RepID=UPI00332C6EF4
MKAADQVPLGRLGLDRVGVVHVHDPDLDYGSVLAARLAEAGPRRGVHPPALRSLDLTDATLLGSPALPGALGSLALRLEHGTDAEVRRLLDGPVVAERLSLHGTPVTDALLAELARHGTTSVDVSRTATTGEGRARFRAEHPDLTLPPRDK